MNDFAERKAALIAELKEVEKQEREAEQKKRKAERRKFNDQCKKMFGIGISEIEALIARHNSHGNAGE